MEEALIIVLIILIYVIVVLIAIIIDLKDERMDFALYIRTLKERNCNLQQENYKLYKEYTKKEVKRAHIIEKCKQLSTLCNTISLDQEQVKRI